MVKATLFERYKYDTPNSIKRLLEKELDVRYFSSKDKFQEWYDTFKEKLWEDDKTKVEMAEGIYIKVEEIDLDDTSQPKRLAFQATFRDGVSYFYAA